MSDEFGTEELVVGTDDIATLTEVVEDDDLPEEEVDADVLIPPVKKPAADVDEDEVSEVTPEEEEMEEIEQLLDPYGEREEALY